MSFKEQEIANLLEKESHLPDLFARFLSPIAPDSTVYSLGVGPGGELPYVRALAPSGRVIAFDNTDDPRIQVMLTHLVSVSRAEFYPIDLSTMSTEALAEQFGSPRLVICRHPELYDHPFWINHLTGWGTYVTENSGQLLVTTYDKLEQLDMLRSLLGKKIVPRQFDVYTNGYVYAHSSFPRNFQSDNFVFVVGGNQD